MTFFRLTFNFIILGFPELIQENRKKLNYWKIVSVGIIQSRAFDSWKNLFFTTPIGNKKFSSIICGVKMSP